MATTPLLMDEADTPLLWNHGAEEHVDYDEARPPRRKRRRIIVAVGAATLAVVACSGLALYATGGTSSVTAATHAAVDTVHQAVDAVKTTTSHAVEVIKDTTMSALAAILPSGVILDDATPRVDTESERTELALDEEVCGATSCRFLVVGHVKEQESKAQLHLSQLAIIASRLNRTLVLPNISGGRYSTCHKHPFDLYHDPEAIAELFGVHVIQWHDFELYTRRRKELARPATAQMLALLAGGNTAGPSYRIDDQAGKACYGTADFDWSAHRPISILTGTPGLKNSGVRRKYGQYVVDILDSSDLALATSLADTANDVLPDVLFAVYSIGLRIFEGDDDDTGAPVLPFHPRWRTLADQIATGISPSIALHWRQEAVRSSNFLPDFVACAKAAHIKLDNLRDELKTVYFMTDFPLNGVVHSETFVRTLAREPEYKKAAEAGIAELFRWTGFNASTGTDGSELAAVKMVTLDELDLQVDLANGSRKSIKDLDAGLYGALDKMVAERVEHYMVGQAQQCGRFSSFSAMVVNQRRVRQGHDGSLIKEPVLYFPEAGHLNYDEPS